MWVFLDDRWPETNRKTLFDFERKRKGSASLLVCFTTALYLGATVEVGLLPIREQTSRLFESWLSLMCLHLLCNASIILRLGLNIVKKNLIPYENQCADFDSGS